MVRRTSGRNEAAPARQTTAPAGTHDDTAQERRTPSTNTTQERAPAPERVPTPAVASRPDTVTTDSTSNLPATQSGQRSMAPVNERNAFEAYGQQMSMTSISGTLIKFNKGDWVTSEDEDVEEEVLNGVVANMDQLMVGWIKWSDNKPVEQIMGPVAEGYQASRRSELGDNDTNQWEADREGRPRDPWQFSNYIVLKVPGEDASDDNLYTFATSSKGGLGAIGSLCREYGKEMRRRPDEYPIVKLGADSYTHAEYGRTYVPLIQIVGWEAKNLFDPVAGATTEPAAEPEPQPEPTRRAASGGGRSRR